MGVVVWGGLWSTLWTMELLQCSVQMGKCGRWWCSAFVWTCYQSIGWPSCSMCTCSSFLKVSMCAPHVQLTLSMCCARYISVPVIGVHAHLTLTLLVLHFNSLGQAGVPPATGVHVQGLCLSVCVHHACVHVCSHSYICLCQVAHSSVNVFVCMCI